MNTPTSSMPANTMPTGTADATTAAIEAALVHFNHLVTTTGDAVASIPGSQLLGKYIRNSYQNDPARVVLELFLFFFAVQYLLSKRARPASSPDSKSIELSQREIDELVDEWVPEPLVPGDADPLVLATDAAQLATIPVFAGPTAAKAKVKLMPVAGALGGVPATHAELATVTATTTPAAAAMATVAQAKTVTLTNLATADVFGFANDDTNKNLAIQALRKYGVGACNPPGFYGTIDVHMQIERELAEFLQVDQAILYAQGFSAVGSVIPAFSKRGDLIVVDDACNFAIQKGVQISRSKLVFFKHNDMHDLEHKLASIEAEDKRLKRPLYRKFLVVEGLYANHGDIAPLPTLLELKNRYKYRLILDETLSFGTLGATGRGLTEHYGVPASSVDLLIGSLGHALASAGGFCAGANAAIEHQRLSASAYVFSAALPPMLAVTASHALAQLRTRPGDLLDPLRGNIRAFRSAVAHAGVFELPSDVLSPLQHLRVARDTLPFTFAPLKVEPTPAADEISPKSSMLSLFKSSATTAQQQQAAAAAVLRRKNADPEAEMAAEEARFLQEIVQEAAVQGVLVVRAQYNVEQEHKCPRPSIKVFVPASLSRKEVENAAKALRSATGKVLAAWAKARK
ncbi:serine palmitoyltransferase component [Allomyces arbusculus]|nr:serine palmitoyltransferase component [Allomyces arbusculus]